MSDIEFAISFTYYAGLTCYALAMFCAITASYAFMQCCRVSPGPVPQFYRTIFMIERYKKRHNM